MSYTTNPYLPKLRAKAVEMVREGLGIRQTARYFGVNPGTVSRWCHLVPSGGARFIPTRSSRPKHHPRELDESLVKRIIQLRRETHNRCAEVVHQMLLNEDIKVSLSSVKRTLDRRGLIKKRSPWKRYHAPLDRPLVAYPGDLVEVDTIHLMETKVSRIYVYSLLDLYSRWAYAKAVRRINARASVSFLNQARRSSPFPFHCLQSDHGSEFSQHFSERIKIIHRHSRVRKPNDNAHLERFNRTLQDELLNQVPRNVRTINRYLTGYLKYYNQERLHLGLNLKTPAQILARCCEAID